MSELLSEKEVKEQLGIDSFRNLKKSQIIEFVSMIPNMDKEVAKACIAQFPQFKEYSTSIINHFDELCKDFADKDSLGSIQAYQSIIDSMRIILEKGEISHDERSYIIDKMVEIASKIEYVEDKKRNFKSELATKSSIIASIGLAIAATILGITVKKK